MKLLMEIIGGEAAYGCIALSGFKIGRFGMIEKLLPPLPKENKS